MIMGDGTMSPGTVCAKPIYKVWLFTQFACCARKVALTENKEVGPFSEAFGCVLHLRVPVAPLSAYERAFSLSLAVSRGFSGIEFEHPSMRAASESRISVQDLRVQNLGLALPCHLENCMKKSAFMKLSGGKFAAIVDKRKVKAGCAQFSIVEGCRLLNSKASKDLASVGDGKPRSVAAASVRLLWFVRVPGGLRRLDRLGAPGNAGLDAASVFFAVAGPDHEISDLWRPRLAVSLDLATVFGAGAGVGGFAALAAGRLGDHRAPGLVHFVLGEGMLEMTVDDLRALAAAPVSASASASAPFRPGKEQDEKKKLGLAAYIIELLAFAPAVADPEAGRAAVDGMLVRGSVFMRGGGCWDYRIQPSSHPHCRPITRQSFPRFLRRSFPRFPRRPFPFPRFPKQPNLRPPASRARTPAADTTPSAFTTEAPG